MHHSSSNLSYNVTFANNFTGCGKLGSLKHWFGEIWRGDLILSSDIMSILPRNGL